jgi:hypothetical protein
MGNAKTAILRRLEVKQSEEEALIWQTNQWVRIVDHDMNRSHRQAQSR